MIVATWTGCYMVLMCMCDSSRTTLTYRSTQVFRQLTFQMMCDTPISFLLHFTVRPFFCPRLFSPFSCLDTHGFQQNMLQVFRTIACIYASQAYRIRKQIRSEFWLYWEKKKGIILTFARSMINYFMYVVCINIVRYIYVDYYYWNATNDNWKIMIMLCIYHLYVIWYYESS